MSNPSQVREIRKGVGGRICRVLLVTDSFAIVECNGDEAVIFLELTPGKAIVEGRDHPEFSDEDDRRPEQGDEILVFVESLGEDGGPKQHIVLAWGYYSKVLAVAQAIESRPEKIGQHGSNGQGNGADRGIPEHMRRRQPRRGMRVAESEPVATK